MKLFLALCLVAAAAVALGERIRFDGYTVKRVTPKSEQQLKTLRGLESRGASFWKEPTIVGRHADILFPPHLQGDVLEGIRASGMQVETFVEDVQALIEQGESAGIKQEGRFGWTDYGTLDEINAFVAEQAEKHQFITSLFSIGKSYEGRDLWVLKIATGGPPNKKAIWLDANIHAREWITSAVSTYLTNELLNGRLVDWTSDFDWYILNVFNPDGFHYTKTTNRLWRKTRSPGTPCDGTDANRNFDFHWLENWGGSDNPCSDIYGGTEPFSEPETAAFRDYVRNTLSKENFVAYISIHSYAQLILLPFGHVNDRIPQYDQYMDIGRRIAAASAQKYGTTYVPGNIVDLLYESSGTSMDWVKGKFNTNFTVTYELRDDGKYGFLLPPEQIIPCAEEFIDGFAVVIQELRAGIITPDFPEEP